MRFDRLAPSWQPFRVGVAAMLGQMTSYMASRLCASSRVGRAVTLTIATALISLVALPYGQARLNFPWYDGINPIANEAACDKAFRDAKLSPPVVSNSERVSSNLTPFGTRQSTCRYAVKRKVCAAILYESVPPADEWVKFEYLIGLCEEDRANEIAEVRRERLREAMAPKEPKQRFLLTACTDEGYGYLVRDDEDHTKIECGRTRDLAKFRKIKPSDFSGVEFSAAACPADALTAFSKASFDSKTGFAWAPDFSCTPAKSVEKATVPDCPYGRSTAGECLPNPCAADYEWRHGGCYPREAGSSWRPTSREATPTTLELPSLSPTLRIGPRPDGKLDRGATPAEPARKLPKVPSGKSPKPESTITGIPEDAAKRRPVGPVTPTPPEHKLSPPKGFSAAPKVVSRPETPAAKPETPSTITKSKPVGGVRVDVKSEGQPEDLDRNDVLKLLRKPAS